TFRGPVSDGLTIEAFADDSVDPVKSTTCYEQDILGIDFHELLVRMLAPTFRRNVHDSAFEQFEQCLLHAFTRHVTRDRRVVAFARDLVDFINEHDSALGFGYVIISGLKQTGQYAFDIL